MKINLKNIWVNVLVIADADPALYGPAFDNRKEAIAERPNQINIANEDLGISKRDLRTGMKTMPLSRLNEILETDYLG